MCMFDKSRALKTHKPQNFVQEYLKVNFRDERSDEYVRTSQRCPFPPDLFPPLLTPRLAVLLLANGLEVLSLPCLAYYNSRFPRAANVAVAHTKIWGSKSGPLNSMYPKIESARICPSNLNLRSH